MSKNKLVAVYGTLKENFHNHAVLGGSEKVYQGELAGWEMYSVGAFPACIRGRGNILIEVYEVTDQAVMVGLDRLEGYHVDEPRSSMYIRETVHVDGLNQDAYIYVWNSDVEGYPRVFNGVW